MITHSWRQWREFLDLLLWSSGLLFWIVIVSVNLGMDVKIKTWISSASAQSSNETYAKMWEAPVLHHEKTK